MNISKALRKFRKKISPAPNKKTYHTKVNGGYVTCSASSMSSSSTTTLPKMTKRITKCSICEKQIGEYYSPWNYQDEFDRIKIRCKTCSQIEELIE